MTRAAEQPADDIAHLVERVVKLVDQSAVRRSVSTFSATVVPVGCGDGGLQDADAKWAERPRK